MKVVNVDSINYHLIDGGYYADKDDIDELDPIEMYTKDEVISMLTELKTEIEKQEYTTYYLEDEDACGFNYGITASTGFIEEKIDKLKEKKK